MRRSMVGILALALCGTVQAQAPSLETVALAKQVLARTQAVMLASPEYQALVKSPAYLAFEDARKLVEALTPAQGTVPPK